MRLPAPPEALRVARALTAFSQQEAADLAGVTRRYISTAETSESMFNLNLNLVDFYVSRGIEFLGQALIGSEVSGAGARWLAPASLADTSADERSRYQSEDLGISFRAARALLNKTQNLVAEETGLTVATVKALERGEHWAAASQAMQDYYERNRVEFLGWSDAATKRFYGVGVRWKQAEK
ncbi:XRE family transcriptional regulator [Rhizobium laguerreae]|nr:XRE family transcriptional regulator [Rhizobium laguerreae]